MSGEKLNGSQVLILKALAKAGPAGMTRRQLKRVAPVNSDNLGPVHVESLENHPKSLIARGLVVVEEEDDGTKSVPVYRITAKGLEYAKTLKALPRLTRLTYEKIPPKILDPAIRQVKEKRTYGLEQFTDMDLREILKLCGPKYADVPLDSLRQQIVNRRKRGAFASKPEDAWPKWYKTYRASKPFKALQRKLVKSRHCAINPGHILDLAAYHIRFDNVGRESETDLIVLCSKCFKRNHKALPKPPDQPLLYVSENQEDQESHKNSDENV